MTDLTNLEIPGNPLRGAIATPTPELASTRLRGINAQIYMICARLKASGELYA